MTKDRARAKSIKYIEWAEKAEAKSKAIHERFSADFKDFDWTQPILLGHHSQRRHQKIYERRDNMHRTINELDAKAKRFREKAENLLIFANTNKGDAERKREGKMGNFLFFCEKKEKTRLKKKLLQHTVLCTVPHSQTPNAFVSFFVTFLCFSECFERIHIMYRLAVLVICFSHHITNCSWIPQPA